MVDGWTEKSELWKDGQWTVDGSWMNGSGGKGGRSAKNDRTNG